jgi:hypothetical protein
MYTQLFWIEENWPGRLASRPRGGDWLEDEMRNWRGLGIDAVPSLLEESEALEAGLGHERDRCEAAGMSFY